MDWLGWCDGYRLGAPGGSGQQETVHEGHRQTDLKSCEIKYII